MKEQIGNLLKVQLFNIGTADVTLALLLSALAVVGLAYLFARISKSLVFKSLTRRGVQTTNAALVPARLVFYLILAVGVVVAVQLIGVDLSGLFAAGAIFTVGLGFAMQNIIQNLVSGIILFAEKSIKPDDVLEVEGNIVQVLQLRSRAIVARTRNQEELIIPNSVFFQNVVKNYTLSDSHYLLGTEVGVHYSSDMKLVKQTLQDVAEQVEWRVKGQEPRVLMSRFGNSSVDFSVFVWTDSPWEARRQQSDLNERIWWALKENGITIAFPQLDVHLGSNIALAQQTTQSHAPSL